MRTFNVDMPVAFLLIRKEQIKGHCPLGGSGMGWGVVKR